MSADTRVVQAVRTALLDAWPDLADDTVHLDQVATIAASSAQLAVARILLEGDIPEGAPARLRPSDDTLAKGAALTTWLYTTAALDHVATAVAAVIADARKGYAAQLRTSDPFELLLKTVAQGTSNADARPKETPR